MLDGRWGESFGRIVCGDVGGGCGVCLLFMGFVDALLL